MTDPPEYKQIFQYMVDHYDFPLKGSQEEKFWVNDLEENQYKRLAGPVSEEKVDFSSLEDAADRIRTFAKTAGADIVGFTKVLPMMVFKGAKVKEKYAVVLGFEMDHEAIDAAPEPPAGKEALRAYWRLGWLTMKVAEFIRSMGYPATGHQVRTFVNDPPTILNPVAGMHAGLGEMGMLGILITPEYGPRVRLGTITTDLELPQGKQIDIGVEEFCDRCKICADECQGDAIQRERSDERGFFKYTIDAHKCLPEFAKYDGCGICIKVCPFNRTKSQMDTFLKGVQRLNDHHKKMKTPPRK
jgi:Pyruvate/2-oxoacid:ferredoxin oxidoreductase delta subunit